MEMAVGYIMYAPVGRVICLSETEAVYRILVVIRPVQCRKRNGKDKPFIMLFNYSTIMIMNLFNLQAQILNPRKWVNGKLSLDMEVKL